MKKTRRSYNSTLPVSKGPTRKARLKTKGRSRFPHRRQLDFCKHVMALFCAFADHPLHRAECECWRGELCDPSHVVKTRAKGADDVGFVLPFCRTLHNEWHDHGRHTFCRKYGTSLDALKDRAERLGRRWREQQGETAA